MPAGTHTHTLIPAAMVVPDSSSSRASSCNHRPAPLLAALLLPPADRPERHPQALIAIVIIVAAVREVPHRRHREPVFTLAHRRILAGVPSRHARSGHLLHRVVAPTSFILRATQLLQGHGIIGAGSLATVLGTVRTLCYALVSYPTGAMADRGAPRPLLIGGYLVARCGGRCC